MSGSPWADPATPTEPGDPYPGPPPTTPVGPPYGHAGPYHPAPQWGAPVPWYPAAWNPATPARPRRPGQVITAAVLAFAQAAVVVVASLYLWFFASIADTVVAEADGIYTSGTVDALATEGSVLATVQVLSAASLVAAGVWALTGRRRAAGLLLAAALAIQVVLAGYWAVRLISEVGGYDTEATILGVALFFALGPMVGLGMLLVGPGRRWFGGTPPA